MNDRAPVVLRRAPTADIKLPVEVGYDTFKLAYDFKAISLVKEKTGKSLLNGTLWETIEEDPDLVITTIWAGLQLYHPEMSLEDVAHSLLPLDYNLYLKAVLAAWTKVKPEAKEKADPKAEPTAEPVAAQKT